MRGEHPGGDAELGLLDLVGVGDDGAAKDLARPRDRGEPAGDEAAGARLGRGERQPALTAGGEDERLDRLLAPRVEELRERPGERRRERLAPLVCPRRDEQVDVDLRLARADGRLDALAVAAGRRERLGDGGLGDAVEAEDVAGRRCRPGEQAAERLAREGGLPAASAAPAAGRAG